MVEQIFCKNPKQFDLLILDLNMSHLNDFELTERIFKQKIEKLGFHSLLLKPYGLNDIFRLISEILKSEKKN